MNELISLSSEGSSLSAASSRVKSKVGSRHTQGNLWASGTDEIVSRTSAVL